MNTFHNRTYKSQLYQGIMGRKFIFDVARVERQEDQTSTLHDCGMIWWFCTKYVRDICYKVELELDQMTKEHNRT